MTLYADVEYLKAAIDGLLAQCPELIDDETLRADMLDGSTEIASVFAAVLKSIREDDIVMAGIDRIAEDLLARKTRAQTRKEAKRNLLTSLMQRANLKKLALPEATLSLSWHQPAPIVMDEAALPDDCIRPVRKANMVDVKEWIEHHGGQLPPGVAMSDGQNVLTIRTK